MSEARPPVLSLGSAERYQDAQFGRDAMKLLPGEYYATARDEIIVTVLGSCVAACIRDPRTGIGGMNHFMLPGAGEEAGDGAYPARYGQEAMDLLVDQLASLGAQRGRMEGKLLGGGRLMKGVADVGEQNIRFAQAYLQQARIPLKGSHLGGAWTRKVYFFPATGQVLVKVLHSLPNATVPEREEAYRRRVNQVIA